MKRTLPGDPQHEEPTPHKKPHQQTKPSYEEILTGIEDLTTDQIHNLTQNLNSLYSLKLNKITQAFPVDLWTQIFRWADFSRMPVRTLLLPLRTVCHTWLKIIETLPKIHTSVSAHSIPKLLHSFPCIKSLNLKAVNAFLDFDFSLLTRLRHLSIGPRSCSPDLAQLMPLTNLTKLTLSSHSVTSLGPLTFLHALSLKHPFALQRYEIDHLPSLTRLVSDSKHLYAYGRGIYKSYQETYDGQWFDHKYHGYGQLRLLGGNMYKGQFKEDLYHGIGTLQYSEGRRYAGEWKEGNMVKGVLTYKDGNRYDGEFQDNTRHGHGTMEYNNGGKFIGEWAGSVPINGTMLYPNGNKYSGEWKLEGPSGQGTMVFTSGNRHSGQWVDGKRFGEGIAYFRNGTVISGMFDGQPHGNATQTYANGNKFVGIFKNGKKSGPGIFYFECEDASLKFLDASKRDIPYNQGDRFEGEWIEGQKDSPGVLYCTNGDKHEGQLVDSRLA